MEHPFLMFLDHTQRRSTVGRTPLDEWSARRRDLYLTTHDNLNRQISMPPVGFEPTISAGERPRPRPVPRFQQATQYSTQLRTQDWHLMPLKATLISCNKQGRTAQPNDWWNLYLDNSCREIEQDATVYQNFIIPYLYEAQHVSGDTPPIIRSLKLH